MGSELLTFHRTHRSLPAALRFAVVKAVAVSAALVFGYVSAAIVADFHEPPVDNGIAVTDQSATRLLAEHHCTTTGRFGPSVQSAVIRRDGRVLHVSPGEGRAVLEGRRAGTLVAVCSAPLG